MRKLTDFEGTWQFSRQIDDRLTGHQARAEGRVIFAPDTAGLRHDEQGVLYLPGQGPIATTRRYLWRDGPAGIETFFDDGRPFHVIGAVATPLADHPCGEDHYHVQYDFGGWPQWQSVWRVRGPRKDYLMETIYLPATTATS